MSPNTRPDAEGIKTHSRSYPGHFLRADVFDEPVDCREYDLIWMSPPCQQHVLLSTSGAAQRGVVERTLEMIQAMELRVWFPGSACPQVVSANAAILGRLASRHAIRYTARLGNHPERSR